MPALIAMLWGALIPVLGSLVGRILVSLGIGYLTFTGVDTSIGWAKASFLTNVSALPATAVGIMGLLHVGKCVSILLSAVTMRITLGGTAGTIKKMVVK